MHEGEEPASALPQSKSSRIQTATNTATAQADLPYAPAPRPGPMAGPGFAACLLSVFGAAGFLAAVLMAVPPWSGEPGGRLLRRGHLVGGLAGHAAGLGGDVATGVDNGLGEVLGGLFGGLGGLLAGRAGAAGDVAQHVVEWVGRRPRPGSARCLGVADLVQDDLDLGLLAQLLPASPRRARPGSCTAGGGVGVGVQQLAQLGRVQLLAQAEASDPAGPAGGLGALVDLGASLGQGVGQGLAGQVAGAERGEQRGLGLLQGRDGGRRRRLARLAEVLGVGRVGIWITPRCPRLRRRGACWRSPAGRSRRRRAAPVSAAR